MKRLLAYWLLPADLERAALERMIEALAKQYNAPLFPPHLTIHAEILEAEPHPRSIQELIHAAARGVRLIVADATGIAESEKFTKTLFIEFATTPELLALAARIRELSADRADYELRPHVSLLYQHLPDAERHNLVRTLQLPVIRVVFDRLVAITGAAGADSPEDVRTWQTVAEVSLR